MENNKPMKEKPMNNLTNTPKLLNEEQFITKIITDFLNSKESNPSKLFHTISIYYHKVFRDHNKSIGRSILDETPVETRIAVVRAEYDKLLKAERWKAERFDKWKSLNRWKYNSGNDGYDHFDVFALNYREHKTFDELYNSEEYAQYLQTLKQPTQ